MEQWKNYPEFKISATHLIYQTIVFNSILTLSKSAFTDCKIINVNKLKIENRALKHLLNDMESVAMNCPNNNNKEFLMLSSMAKKTQRSFDMKPLENQLLYILKDDEKYLSKL